MPVITSGNVWRSRVVLTKMLNALGAIPAAKFITTGLVHLFKSSLTINQDTPLATFTAAEATFSGYSSVALAAPTGPVNNLPGQEGILYAGHTFTEGSPATVANNIFGYWLDENAGADWVLAEQFASPIPMANPGDFIELNLIFAMMFQLQSS